jgi:hypothetical protein
VALTARELNFDKFKSGGMHGKHAVTTLEVRKQSPTFLSYDTDRIENEIYEKGTQRHTKKEVIT